MRMKRLALLLCFAATASVSAAPIPGISDIKTSTFPFRFDFDCPTIEIKEEDDRGRVRAKTKKLYKKCWVSFEDDAINIMDRQTIKKEDVISGWSDYDHIDLDAYGIGNEQKFTWNILYKSQGQHLVFKFVRKQAPVTGSRRDVDNVHEAFHWWLLRDRG